MPENGTSGSMSGDGKRSDCPKAQATAPILDSTTNRAHRGSESAKVVVLQRLLDDSRGAPMPTECSAESFDFGTVKGRPVEAAVDGGLVTPDAGALLLGATDRAIDLVDQFALCF